MITDVHTHILYDIDDGAKDISESLKLIQAETGNGIDTIVFTPHFDPHSDSMDIFAQKCRERYDILTQSVRESNGNIMLILGSETFYSSLLLYYSTLEPLCIANTRYLILEFAIDTAFNKTFFAELEKLILKFDIVPIVAHAERYTHIKRHMNIIEKLKELGCVIQINANYVIQNIDGKFVKRLFRYGYVDMVASDCHDSVNRTPNLKEAIDLINEKYNGYYDKIILGKYTTLSGW